MKRLFYPTTVLAAAAAVGITATAMGGRGAVVFLVLATLLLGWIGWLLQRMARALTREAAVTEVMATGGRRKELEREKQALLKAIKELDFDHQMGKVSAKDFAESTAQYRARTIRVMRQLDQSGQDYEKMIAAAVRERQAATEVADAVAPPLCGQCQTRNDEDADFCKKCGRKLSSKVAS